jgi:hypothetical protein
MSKQSPKFEFQKTSSPSGRAKSSNRKDFDAAEVPDTLPKSDEDLLDAIWDQLSSTESE